MEESTSKRILDYIRQNGQTSGKELVPYLGTIGSRAVRKQLKNLLDKGLLNKVGRPPKVVGSGSTLNETARQIKRKGICRGRIIGVAITGSFKGFDVISEV